jgi:hypothetical protein
MSAIVLDRRRHAATYVVLVALGLFYAVSLAIFVRTDRSASTVLRVEGQPPVRLVLSQPVLIGYYGCGPCRRSGWSAPEADWSWTIADTATLIFAPPAVPGLDTKGLDAKGLDARGLDARGLEAQDLVLDIDAGAFLPRDMRRTLRVAVGGEPVGEVQFLPADPMNDAFFSGAHFVHSFRVPGRLMVAGPIVEIGLHMARVGPPRMHYWSTERRQIGVAVRSVSVRIAQ